MHARPGDATTQKRRLLIFLLFLGTTDRCPHNYLSNSVLVRFSSIACLDTTLQMPQWRTFGEQCKSSMEKQARVSYVTWVASIKWLHQAPNVSQSTPDVSIATKFYETFTEPLSSSRRAAMRELFPYARARRGRSRRQCQCLRSVLASFSVA
jgi:hypothetical protein